MTDEDKVADIVSSFATYEDFLDSQITQQDLFYLEDEELGRQLVELGYRGNGELLKGPGFSIITQSYSLFCKNTCKLFTTLKNRLKALRI